MKKKQELIFFNEYKGNGQFEEIPLNRKSTRAKFKIDKVASARKHKRELERIEKQALKRINKR